MTTIKRSDLSIKIEGNYFLFILKTRRFHLILLHLRLVDLSKTILRKLLEIVRMLQQTNNISMK